MLGAVVYRIVRWLARRLPRPVGYRLARAVGSVFYVLTPGKRRAVLDNLTRVLGDRGKARPLVRRVFCNFGMYLFDFFRSERLTEESVRRLVHIENPEHVERAYRSGRGAICLTGHLGHWELGGQLLALIGYPLTAVVLPHRSPKVDELFIAERKVAGLNPVPVGIAVRECYKALRRGELVALVGDWDTTESGIEIEFFGGKVTLPKGPAAMAVRTGAMIVPGCVIRDRGYDFTLHTLEPFEPVRTGDRRRDELETAKLCRDALENFVARWPEQWFMFRRIWSDQR